MKMRALRLRGATKSRSHDWAWHEKRLREDEPRFADRKAKAEEAMRLHDMAMETQAK